MSKIILILSLSNLDNEQVSYYQNLVNEVKQTYANEIDVLLTLNSMQIFNGNFSYEKYENEIYEFGCTCSNDLLEKYKLKEGKEFGQKIRLLEELWLNNGFKLSKKDIDNVLSN